MKYFRHLNELSKYKNLERIAGEMINISLGSTYFDNGILLENPKPGHNLYKIDSVEYEIHPNCGFVYLLTSTVSDEFTLLESKFRELMMVLNNKFGIKKANVGAPGTTQYMLLENKTNITGIDIQILNSVSKNFFENYSQ